MNPTKLNIPNDINWDFLKRFNICAHSSSFVEAAKKLGTSQASLLRQMDVLETELGKNLFERTAKYRSMELTPDGKLLKSITDQLFEIVNKQVVKKITNQQSNNELKQSIKIITTPGLSTTLLAEPIADFAATNSNVNFEVSAQIFPRKLSTGEIMIRHDFLHQENLKAVHLVKISTNFYASEQYLKKFGQPKSYDDLINHQVLAFKYFNVSSTDMYALSHERVFYLEPIIQSDYIGFLIEIAFRNLGVIELPDIHPATKRLKKITSIPSQSSDIFMGYMDLAGQSQSVYDFVKFLKNFNEKE